MQVSKNGEELLCDAVSDIKILNISSGQPSVQSALPTETTDDKTNIAIQDAEAENSFKNAQISADEGDTITSMAFSPDGTKLIVAFKSLRLRLYLWPSRTLVLTFLCYHRSPVCCIAWDASSTIIMTGAADGTCRVWDVSRNICLHAIRGVPGVFGSAVFHPCLIKHCLLYAGVNNVLYVWKLNTDCSYEVVHKLADAHHMKITSVLITGKGDRLVTLGLDRVAILWDALTLRQLLVGAIGQAVCGGVLLPMKPNEEGVRVLVGGEKGYLSVWHLHTKAKEVFRSESILIKPPEGEENSGVLAISEIVASEALDSVLVSSFDNNILFLKSESLQPWKLLCGNNDQVLSTVLVTAPEEPGDEERKRLLVAATNSPELRVYDLECMGCVLLRGHTATVLSLARHPSLTDMFASSSHDCDVRIWRTTSNSSAVCVAIASGHCQSVASIALGSQILVSSGQDRCIKTWPLLEELSSPIKCEGTLDLIGSKSVTSPQALQCSFTQIGHEKDINCVVVSKKDHLIATASRDKSVKLWEGKDLALIKTLNGHKRGVWSLSFSPVDKVLASASADGTICVWSLQTFTLMMVSNKCFLVTFILFIFFLRDFIFKKTLFEKLQY